MAFEALLAPEDSKPKKWRRRMVMASLIGHAVALVAGVAHAMWQVEELPMPSIEVTLVAAAPPPPPPPPPAKKKRTKTKTRKVQPKQDVLVQPKDVPQEPEEAPPEEEDDGEDEGVEGGVAGGVAGGVVGGVVGGTGKAPPPPKKTGPAMVSASIGRKLLLINPSSPAYSPKVPRGLKNRKLSALVQICANERGAVTSARVLRGTGTPIDGQLPSVLRRWRYKPASVGGKPTAFCYKLNYVISAH